MAFGRHSDQKRLSIDHRILFEVLGVGSNNIIQRVDSNFLLNEADSRISIQSPSVDAELTS